jgi:outer membrane protein OmpA-like peptidoglycan-associated protein
MTLAMAIAIPAVATAQVHVETVPSRSVELEAYLTTPTNGRPPIETEPVEFAALRLLALARQDLSEQRTEPARRALEMLVARYPDSASATPARRELLRLYSADTEIGSANRSAMGSLPPASTTSTVASAGTTSDVSSANSSPLAGPQGEQASGWRTTVVGFRRLQDEFRNTIGDRVFFAAGSEELGARARAVLAAQAQWLADRPQVEIIVEGHADDTSVGADNDMLAAGRARAVRDRLVAEGLPPARIIMTAKGDSDPVAVCAGSDCSAQNRRAVIAVRLPGVETKAAAVSAGGRNAGVERP